MRKRLLVAVLALAFVAALALPASALATTKASTAFRPISNYYRIPNGSAETSVTGRLIYSKMVRSGSKYVRVGGGLKGTVYLFWFNRTTRHYQSLASTVTAPTGFFALPATQGGDYYVLFKGSSSAHSAIHYLEVFSDAFTVSNLSVAATREPDGSAFVVASADMAAPASVFTTASPGFGYFDAHQTEVSDAYFTGFESTSYLRVPNNGTYKWGFSVPASELDEKLELSAALESDGYYWQASQTTSFTVSSLLGP
jgi:hypothetical protein